jgi:hypothetical protein
VLYVADSVDEVIYSKEDWADLTGEGANDYWQWGLGEGARQADGPPARPRPTEEQEWERLGKRAPVEPMQWLGVVSGLEYSVDTMGTVTNSSGSVIANPQGVGDLVTKVRGRPGGRFRVTPAHRLVLISGDQEDRATWYVAGQLTAPFVVAADDDLGEFWTVDSLRAGDPLTGPDDRSGGSYRISQKRGGIIERRVSAGTEYAVVGNDAPTDLAANAERVLTAWRQALTRGIAFHLTAEGHAWYLEGGAKRYLATAPGGFAWPSDLEVER